MKTVFASLPFYDSLSKQDLERSKAIIPIHCPRTQLPPFQWNSETVDMGDVTKIELIDRNGNNANNYNYFNSWVDGSTVSFASSGLDITSMVTSNVMHYAKLSRDFVATAGDVITITGTLTMVSGVGINLALYGGAGYLCGTTGACADLVAGTHTYTLTVPTTETVEIRIGLPNVPGNAEFSFTNVSISITRFEDYFPTLPTATVWSTNTYGIYNGDTLNYLLPLGLYYVKITTENNFVLYSDWIMIQNIYENLITGWTNDGFETLTTSGTRIINAIETGIYGQCVSDIFTVRKGETVKCIFTLTGDPVTVVLYNSDNTAVYVSDTASTGLNEISLTTTWDGNAMLALFTNSAATLSTSEVWVQRTYSPHFIQLAFKNTKNLGDIFYDGTFEQKVWLDAILNTPTHETITFGEEKDGEFIAEKLVSKFIYSVIAYVSRSLYQCLSRLPLHDTITITDDVGDTFSPAVGNVTVEQPEWIGFETCKLTIKFNNGENSNFVWTK